MTRYAALIAFLLSTLATGCVSQTSTRTQAAEPGVRFILVRHAEKATDDPKDPTLSEAGMVRAKRLAASLADARVVAAYATQYRRTQLTAAPTSMSHHLDLQTYDASIPAFEFARQLRDAHRTGTVLVVGHSNTIPALAAVLCACEVAPMREDEFDRRIEIRVATDGSARMDVQRD
jgi:broad specificity phosphatase PhoE